MTIEPIAQAPTDRLALLYQASQAFNSSLDLDEVLNRVMDEVISITRAERGFVMLREAGGSLTFRAARGMDQNTIEQPEFQISRGVVEQVAQKGEPVLTSDAQSDDRFRMRQSVFELKLRAILCAPLKIKDKVIGVIYVDNRLRAGIFASADLDMLAAIAASAAIAIENARLYQVAVEKGRMERELQMAHQVQVALLPRKTPAVLGWEFAAYWQPAREVAGDYYDFLPSSDNQIGLVIADVSDKGMPAALFMALTRSTVRASVDRTISPAAGITRANRLLCADAMGGMFVTLFYALLNPQTNHLAYVNAGHNPPLFFRAAKDTLVPLTRTGIAMGVAADEEYEEAEITAQPGDFVLLYTDGVPDATNAERQTFGMERLRQLVIAQRLESAAAIVSALEDAIQGFIGPTAPYDDITIVVAKCQK